MSGRKLSGEMPRHNTRLATITWLAPVFPRTGSKERSGTPQRRPKAWRKPNSPWGIYTSMVKESEKTTTRQGPIIVQPPNKDTPPQKTTWLHSTSTVGVPKDLDEAIYWYRRSAQHGDPTGQCNLATLYFTGEGIPTDDSAAARWFRAAAEQGLPAAQTNLAFMYYHGKGVPLDYARAAVWTRQAAEQGYAQAQTELGYLYEQGKGVPLDYVTAYAWFSRAAEAGDDRGASRMKNISRVMTRAQLAAAIIRSANLPGPEKSSPPAINRFVLARPKSIDKSSVS